MSAEQSPIEFYFDVISPYAYLAWTRIEALAQRHGRGLEVKPALFAAMLGHHGHLGPAEIPPKRRYIFKNVLRLAHDLGEPLSPPPAHPFNPLLALRVVTALPQADRPEVVTALYRATWGGGGGVASADDVRAALLGLSLDVEALLAAAVTPENKARLRDETAAAIAKGVFGVPTVVADGELFWGLDALGHVEAFLRGEDPVNEGLLARWEDLPSGAQRPR